MAVTEPGAGKRRVGWLSLLGLVGLMGLAGLAGAAEPIKVGALYNLTGGMASIDGPGLKGVQLRLKQVNEAGGVLGRPLELIVRDSRTDLNQAAKGAQELVAKGVTAVIGYGDSSFVLAAGPVLQGAGVPFITSGATLPDLPRRVGDLLFMTAFGDDDQAKAMAAYAYKTLKIRTVALWSNPIDDYSRTLAELFKKSFLRLGGIIGGEDFLGGQEKNYVRQVEHLKSLGERVQGVFVAAGPEMAARAVTELRRQGVKLPILGGDGFDTDLIITEPGPRLATAIYFTTHAYRAENRPEVWVFSRAYRRAFDHTPEDGFAALGYDAAGILVEAIKRAGSTDKPALRQALAATRDFPGVTGMISYLRPGAAPVKPVAIIGVQYGRYTLLETWQPH